MTVSHLLTCFSFLNSNYSFKKRSKWLKYKHKCSYTCVCTLQKVHVCNIINSSNLPTKCYTVVYSLWQYVPKICKFFKNRIIIFINKVLNCGQYSNVNFW